MDIIESLKRYRIFQFDYSNAGKVYLEAVDWIDRLNAFMGICYFDPKVSRLQPRFIWGITTLFIYIYLAFESTYWYRNDVEKLLLCITTHGFSVQVNLRVVKCHLCLIC